MPRKLELREAPEKDRDDVNKVRRLNPPPLVPAERVAARARKQQIHKEEEEADEDNEAGPACDDFEPDSDPDNANNGSFDVKE